MKRKGLITALIAVSNCLAIGCDAQPLSEIVDLWANLQEPNLTTLDDLVFQRTEMKPASPAGTMFESTVVFEGHDQIPCSHGAVVQALPDNGLIAVWYAGSAELGEDTAIYQSLYSPDANTWSAPKVIADTPDADGNPVVFRSNANQLAIFWVSPRNDHWWTNQWYEMISNDWGSNWSEPLLLRDVPSKMLRSKPIITRNGNVILPVYDQAFYYSLYFVRPVGATQWISVDQPHQGFSPLQPVIVETAEGKLIAFHRAAHCQKVLLSQSTDGGMSWSETKPTCWPNPNSGLDAIYLPDTQEILLVFNNHAEERIDLTVALSADDGQTWHSVRQISPGNSRWHYPSLTQTPDGNIHIAYTIEKHSIGHTACSYNWIAASIPQDN